MLENTVNMYCFKIISILNLFIINFLLKISSKNGSDSSLCKKFNHHLETAVVGMCPVRDGITAKGESV